MQPTATTEQFLTKVDEIVAEKPKYRKGGSATDGTCDCVGMIIGAIRRAGGSWPGTHGSNYAARYETTDLQKITSSTDLQIGMVVYRAHEPGESGYDADRINKTYKGHPDKRDYYHMGVVIGQYPLRIAHCTSPTTKIDTSLGKWNWCGRLKRLSDVAGKEEPEMTTATTTADRGTTVNLRKGPSASSDLVDRINIGQTVEILDETGDWTKVKWKNKTGYIMTGFLIRDLDDDGTDETSAPDGASNGEKILELLQKIRSNTNEIEKLIAKG